MTPSVRSALRSLLLDVGSVLPRRAPRSQVRFFYGHSMVAAETANFRRILMELRRDFEFVDVAAAVALARDPDPPSGHYLAFSFDDGLRECHDLIAPLLMEHGATACFFVCPNFIECDESYRRWFLSERLRIATSKEPMTWTMVRRLMSNGFDIGAHTQDHFDLGTLTLADAGVQIVASQEAIEERLGRHCRYFAWPYGRTTNFPPALIPLVQERFKATFSAIRSRALRSYGGAVFNRDYFEPGWPPRHVRYFARRVVDLGAAA